MARPSRPRSGDVEITASVTGEELTFHEAPETAVEFPGDADQESASGSDRVNLPDQVETGVTYRDVRVDYRIASRLTDPDHPTEER
ncbi:hypothetical protein [Allosalinactinospora lopnorensis]|uniref:hypothetical protein n=1 Tax=Allosalinactinospora lopnorensis TaxID=1352348 RepID=UPI000623F2C7|nr:hypothetical protein [Allosalinactinospora lopnorensis]